MDVNSEVDQNDSEDVEGLNTFLEELNRLQEMSDQRAAELRRAEASEASLTHQADALQYALLTERQATLQAELEAVTAEVTIQRATDETAGAKSKLQEALTQLHTATEQVEKMSVPHRCLQHASLALCSSSAASTRAATVVRTLLFLSHDNHLRQEYVCPLQAMAAELVALFRQSAFASSKSSEVLSAEALDSFLRFLGSLLNNAAGFDEDERAAVAFALRCDEKLGRTDAKES